jgi:hypothetical protein
MASHENEEGWLDYGSGRYKLIGRPGRDDYYLHAGEWLEVWTGMQWVAVQVLADEWGVGTSWMRMGRVCWYRWGCVPDCEG